MKDKHDYWHSPGVVTTQARKLFQEIQICGFLPKKWLLEISWYVCRLAGLNRNYESSTPHQCEYSYKRNFRIVYEWSTMAMAYGWLMVNQTTTIKSASVTKRNSSMNVTSKDDMNAYKVIQMHNSHPLYNGCDNIRTPSSAWFRSWPPWQTRPAVSCLTSGDRNEGCLDFDHLAHSGDQHHQNALLSHHWAVVRGLLVVIDSVDDVSGCACWSSITAVKIWNSQCRQKQNDGLWFWYYITRRVLLFC